MARRSLRPNLNQIRTWVRQGRTDAWIAHQLEVDGEEIARFKADNDLTVAEDGAAADVAGGEVDLRAEDDARIAEELEAAEAARIAAEEAKKAEEAARAAERAARGEDDEEEDGAPRRRRRRGGRRKRGGSSTTTFEGTFDHGEEGYGLWLDPAVADSAVYAEHWAGHRPVEVTVEGDQIIIRRAGEGDAADED